MFSGLINSFRGTGLVLALLLILGCGYLYFDETALPVKEISIHFEEKNHSREFLKQLETKISNKLQVNKGKNLLRISLSQTVKLIQENPWVLTADVSRGFPNQLNIGVRLKKIAFIQPQVAWKYRCISVSGEVLPSLSFKELPDVPMLMTKGLSSAELLDVIEAYQKVPEKGLISRETITEIYWRGLMGLSVKVFRENGQITIGQFDIPIHIKRASTILSYMRLQQKQWRVIDASFTQKVLVKLRNRS